MKKTDKSGVQTGFGGSPDAHIRKFTKRDENQQKRNLKRFTKEGNKRQDDLVKGTIFPSK